MQGGGQDSRTLLIAVPAKVARYNFVDILSHAWPIIMAWFWRFGVEVEGGEGGAGGSIW